MVCAETFASFFSKVVESVPSALSSIRLLAWLFSESRVVLFVGGLCSGAKVLDDLSLESSSLFFAKRAAARAFRLFASLLALAAFDDAGGCLLDTSLGPRAPARR